MGMLDQRLRITLYLRTSWVIWKPGYDVLREEDYLVHNFIYLRPTKLQLRQRTVIYDLIFSMEKSEQIILRAGMDHE